jgi:hypothetical protein
MLKYTIKNLIVEGNAHENKGMFTWCGDRKPHMHILLLILVILRFKSRRLLFM